MSTNDRQTQVAVLVSLQSELGGDGDPKISQSPILVSLQGEINADGDPKASQVVMLVSYLPPEVQAGADALFFGCNI